MINIYEPFLNKENTKYAHDAIDSTWISSHGKYINLIKDRLSELSGSKYVLLCNNGTTATHLLSIGLKYKYPKIKNLIVPNNVYVAAWNSFLVNPIFNIIPVDSNLETWNVDSSKLNTTVNKYSHEDTAILVVHNIGNIVNVPNLKKKYPNFTFVEDNCEGFLGEYNGFKSGSKSLISSVSFFGNKTLTCGEGGAVFTDDENIFEYLNSVRTQGSTSKKFIFDKLGYNYRMTNIQAALLYGQIESIKEIIDTKYQIFELYRKNLNGFVNFQKNEDNTKNPNWMFGIRYKNDIDLSKLSLSLFEQGIETRPIFSPISYHKHLNKYSIDNENSEILYKSVMILPSHPNLEKNQIIYISNMIKKSLNNE
jgi:perosamine synthetase